MRYLGELMALAMVATPLAALAHVTVWPKQSGLGERERYAIRVPNEKMVATVRIEAAFPPEVRVTSFEQKAGWTVEAKRDAAGTIVGATWTGSLPAGQFTEFGILAVNPKAGASLSWKFTQSYADGSLVSWSGAKGTSAPAPDVDLIARSTDGHH